MKGKPFILSLLVFCLTVTPAWGGGESNAGDLSPKIGPILRSEIIQGLPASGEREESFGDGGLVKVILVINRDHLMPLPESLINEARERVERLGGHIGDHAYNNIQAWLPLDSINSLAEWNEMLIIRTPIVPQSNAIKSEGINTIGVPNWHNNSIKGKGVKIGIIDLGFQGYSSLIGTELPISTTVGIWGTWNDFLSDNHGTACAEIVYDVAPDADLFLVNVADFDVDWHNAVSWLSSKKVGVISSSIARNLLLYCKFIYQMLHGNIYGYYYGYSQLVNYEQISGQVNLTVKNAISQGTAWVQSAGNFGQQKWKGNFTDLNKNYLLDFSPYNDFNEIVLPSNFSYGKEVYIVLAWGLDNNFLTYDDYDLIIMTSLGNSSKSQINQQNTPLGMEALKFTPVPGVKYYLAIEQYYARPQELTLLVGVSDFASLEYFSPERTISLTVPSENENVISVGAVHHSNPGVIEPFSSQGPAPENRIKPDLVAPDGVSTKSRGVGNFYGTSAAAPHVAGVCALVKQRHPTWTPAQIKSFLEANALDLGTPGKDNVFGSGLVRLPAIGSFGIIYPNGGEVLAKGSNYQIQWDPTGGGTDVAIALYKGGGYVGVIAGKTANTGSLSWNIPASLANGSDYLIKIRSFSNASVYDFSDGYFTIQGPTFGILSPNGGEAWEKGQKVNINWNTGNLGGDVAIALYKAGAYVTVISGLTANDGHFEWSVPPAIQNGDDYKIKIRSYISNAIFDFSDSNFSVTGTTLKVLSPNGGETLYRGGTHTITWAPANGGTDVAIALYKSGGYGCVISGKTANDGSFSWAIPPSLPVGSDYKIKIRDFTNFTIYDFSDFSFTIM